MSNENDNKKLPIDFMGNVIGVGDTIVYPSRVGSALWMQAAIVDKITNKSVGEAFTLHVMPVQPPAVKNRRYVWGNERGPGIVKCLERVVVIRKYKDKLEEYTCQNTK